MEAGGFDLLSLDDTLAEHRDFIMKTTCASYVFE